MSIAHARAQQAEHEVIRLDSELGRGAGIPLSGAASALVWWRWGVASPWVGGRH